ncbi:MAG: pyruvate kinase alpha/beta domain-containing protein [Bacillota bacterium]
MYWPTKGSVNTAATVEAALSRARELGLRHIVVASCSGATAEHFIGAGLDIVCVTHQVGFESSGVDEMPPETRARLRQAGIKVLTATHLLAGLDRALRFKFGGVYPAEIVAAVFRMFGQGLKVCVEISSMALDAGLIPFGADVVAVAGTASGADTAVVITPAHSQHFFDGKIREIICKPRDF